VLKEVLSNELKIQEKLGMDFVLTQAMQNNLDSENNEKGILSIKDLQKNINKS